ncbi:MAG TPA: hypothetical protein VGC54_08555 [Planctomycetota bacterium]
MSRIPIQILLGAALLDSATFVDFATAAPGGNSANAAPVAVLRNVVCRPCQGDLTIVEIDGSASYDPDGDPLTYRWFVNDDRARLLTNDTEKVTLVLDTSSNCFGQFPVGLRVSDGVSSSTDSTVVTIKGEDQDCCKIYSELKTLQFAYTGEDCTATYHSQDPGKVTCSGDPLDAPQVVFLAYDTSDPSLVWYDGIVDLGGKANIEAAMAGKTKLGKETALELWDVTGTTLLQRSTFHTSCSQNVRMGDNYGGLALVNCVPGGRRNRDICSQGRPGALILGYTGEDCSATHHNQDPTKVSCNGDPMFLDPVRIVAQKEGDPTQVYFDGLVALGDKFTMDAAAIGRTELHSSAEIFVIDPGTGATLQTVVFHTSCSQPLALGDQFGSIEVCGFIPPGGSSRDYCSGGGKPHLIQMVFVGGDCSQMKHDQDPGKVSCSGDSTGLLQARIVARNGDGRKIYFDGEVDRLGAFDIDAKVAGDSALDKELFVDVYDASGTLVQTIGFHASCSQPIRQRDRFSCVIVAGFLRT